MVEKITSLQNPRIKNIVKLQQRSSERGSQNLIVIEGLRGESSIAELCRREDINANLFYKWSKDFLEAGKNRLNGDIKREATTTEVHHLKNENMDLKQLVAELSLENRMLKKSLTGSE